MAAMISALMEEGTKADCIAQIERLLTERERLRAALELGRVFMAEQTDENAARFETALKIR